MSLMPSVSLKIDSVAMGDSRSGESSRLSVEVSDVHSAWMRWNFSSGHCADGGQDHEGSLRTFRLTV